MTDIKTIGVMTCGGDCPGLNPVIRGVVLSAIRKYGWKVIGIEDSMQGLINLDYKSPNGNMPLTEQIVDDILARGGTILGSDNHSDPFRFAVVDPETKKKIEKDVSDTVIENFKKLNLDALVVVGGDGSMRIAKKLMDKGNIPIVGVPKTIDNDLASTDYTFGFNTAVQTITEALDKIRDTARSHDRIVIVEVMGRDAGWLALHGGIAGGAHVILIPEIPYKIDAIMSHLEKRESSGSPFHIIVIAEGAKPVDGPANLETAKPGEMARYSGAGQRLLQLIESHPNHLREARVSVLGYIQRGGSPTNFDRVLGTQLGQHAVELIAQKKFGYMCSLKTPEIVSVKIEDACKVQKLVDPESQLVHMSQSIGISLGQ